MAKDYYNILGVGKNASKEDIKKAYRKLAHQHHPDKGGNDTKFKEISEAYQVLSNDSKRAQYDRFGSTFEEGGFGNFQGEAGDFGNINFGDIDLEDILGGVFGFGNAKEKAAHRMRGEDISIDLELSLEDAYSGLKREIELKKNIRCETCTGNGAEPGSNIVNCKNCGGSGNVQNVQRTFFGAFTRVGVCPECRGAGKSPEKKCGSCHGEGRKIGTEKIPVVVPPGVGDEEILKITGKGDSGQSGHGGGDLYVKLHVKKHPQFQRKGEDIYIHEKITISQAVLGGKIAIPTLGGEVILTIPSGTQSGTLLRLSEKGMPRLYGGGSGHQYVEVEIDTPKRLSRSQKELFEKLKEEGL